jgi:uncharacterized membrane protein YgcG
MEYANIFLLISSLIFLIQLIRVKRKFNDLDSFVQQLNKIYKINAQTQIKESKKEFELPTYMNKLITVVSVILLGVVVFFLGAFIATLISITFI